MIPNITAWLLAHLLSDFIFQPNKMVKNKKQFPMLLAHGAIIFLTSLVFIGGHWQSAIFISITHMIIDAIKTQLGYRNFLSFVVDQLVHIAMIIAATQLWPEAWSQGLWAHAPMVVIKVEIILCAVIASAYMGGYLVGEIMKPFEIDVKTDDQDIGLKNAGKLIGQLERLLILLMMLIGQAGGIGFLIAAKSILRFDTVKKSRAVSEYIIIGTLASFAWAMLIAYFTEFALAQIALHP